MFKTKRKEGTLKIFVRRGENMEERLEDMAARLYAELCRQVHEERQEEPTLLKSMFNLAFIILILGSMMAVGIIIDRIFRISQSKDFSGKKREIEISLYN